MQQSVALNHRGLNRKAVVLAAILVTFAAVIAWMAGPTPSANATPTNTFCTKVHLNPMAECDMGTGYAAPYAEIGVQNFERAGCVKVTGYYGDPVLGWSCYGSYSINYVVTPQNPNAWYRGAIRSNNMSYAAYFSGLAVCCWTQ